MCTHFESIGPKAPPYHLTHPTPPTLHPATQIYSHTTRFALACNTSSKIIEPIQSRCAILRFSRLSDDVRGLIGLDWVWVGLCWLGWMIATGWSSFGRAVPAPTHIHRPTPLQFPQQIHRSCWTGSGRYARRRAWATRTTASRRSSSPPRRVYFHFCKFVRCMCGCMCVCGVVMACAGRHTHTYPRTPVISPHHPNTKTTRNNKRAHQRRVTCATP